MRKILYTIIFILVAFIIAVAVINELGETPVAEPDIEGFIFSIEDNSILVAEGLLEGDEHDGDVNNLQGDAYTFSITADTEIVNENGELADVDELRVNQEVYVWHTGVVMESYPMQAEAVRIVITGAMFSQELIADRVAGVCDADSSEGRLNILHALDDNWEYLEAGISARPVQGSTGGSWTAPRHAQFIGNERMLIAFEDGHIMLMAVVEYNCENGVVADVSVVADDIGLPDGFPFANVGLWMSMVEIYGDENYEVSTYAKEAVISGEFVQFDDWREIGDNVFVR